MEGKWILEDLKELLVNQEQDSPSLRLCFSSLFPQSGSKFGILKQCVVISIGTPDCLGDSNMSCLIELQPDVSVLLWILNSIHSPHLLIWIPDHWPAPEKYVKNSQTWRRWFTQLKACCRSWRTWICFFKHLCTFLHFRIGRMEIGGVLDFLDRQLN